MQAKELIHILECAVAPLYEGREAHQIALLVAAYLADLGDYTAPLVADPTREIPVEKSTVERYAARLAAGEPMQYIIGTTDFFGRTFAVDGRVLIPRPETEELVDWIRREERAARRLLDVGTGSGCIATTLALELPEARVFALDISPEALAVARANAIRLGAEVDFREGDALKGLAECFDEQFDVIVSNPPYVPDADRATMHCNVLENEPHLALFVPDEDILCFYRAIAEAGRTLLVEGGKLYFEIYHEAAEAMRDLMERLGYEEVVVRCDLQDKPRMLCCRNPRR
ncbi:MAG: peptide chain release factor N(5)-glutamine methyltransferase [Rikenellaceae bacterium]|nr:peptide chain release factor N(5)-glutamine methyltransferase [Rikenellaceae bacterium]